MKEETIEEFGQVVQAAQRKTASGKLAFVKPYIRSGIGGAAGEEEDEEALNPTIQYVIKDLMDYSEEHILPARFMEELDVLIQIYEENAELMYWIVRFYKGVDEARNNELYQTLVDRNAVILKQLSEMAKFDPHFGYNPNFETDAPEKMELLIKSKNLINYYGNVYLPEAEETLLHNPTIESLDLYGMILKENSQIEMNDMLIATSNVLEIYAKQLLAQLKSFTITVEEVNIMYSKMEREYIKCIQLHEELINYFATTTKKGKSNSYKLNNIWGYKGIQNVDRVIQDITDNFSNLKRRYVSVLVEYKKIDEEKSKELFARYEIHNAVLNEVFLELKKALENLDNENILKYGSYYKDIEKIINNHITKLYKEIKKDKEIDNLPVDDKIIGEMIRDGRKQLAEINSQQKRSNVN